MLTTTVTPSSILRNVAGLLLEMADQAEPDEPCEVNGTVLALLIGYAADVVDPAGRLRADTITALAKHAEQPSLETWLPAEQPLPVAIVAGVMRTCAHNLEVAA